METPEKDPGPDGIADWQTRSKLVLFIKELTLCGRVDLACKKAKAGRGWIYKWRQHDADFLAAFEEARACGLEALKDEAFRRAYEGVAEPRFHQGEICGEVQKYSDTLLMFLIKQSDPSYREHYQIDHGNVGSRPFLFQMSLHPDALAAQTKN